MVTHFTFSRWVVIGLCLACVSAWSGQFEVGLTARERGDFTAAFSTFKPLASAGDANAQFQLSLLYAAGQGVKADVRESLYWLRQAATQGHVLAQSNLGVAFNRGRGVAQNEMKAYAWFTMAASAGDAVATTNKGVASQKFSPTQLEQAKALALQCQQGNFKPCL
jgi:TPR repeat protein